MKVSQKNELLKKALSIRGIEFVYYRSDKAHWKVTLESGEQFSVVTHYFGTESSVLRLAAEKLAKMGRAVQYPKGA
jgi:hypothetical protein